MRNMPDQPIRLSFTADTIPSLVVVSGVALESGFGADGNTAWAAHNLISPSDGSSVQNYAGSNGGALVSLTPNLRITLSALNATYSKIMQSAAVTTQPGEWLATRVKLNTADAGNIGRQARLVATNSNGGFNERAVTSAALTSALQTITATVTCSTSQTNTRWMIEAFNTNFPTDMHIEEMQLYKAPMSPDRWVSTSDATAPFDIKIAEFLDHFQTSGVRRGLRCKASAETVSYPVRADGIYNLKYYYLSSAASPLLSAEISQLAVSGRVALTPPVGEHVYKLEISNYPIPFALDEYPSNGFVIGASEGGLNGANATAPLPLTGDASIGDVIEARVSGPSTVDWHVIGTCASQNWSFKTSRVPRGSGYTPKVRIQSVPSVVKAMTNKCEVADLIAMTGDSLMASWATSARNAFINELKIYNGNNNVYMEQMAAGGSKLIDDQGISNSWLYIPGGWANSASITQTTDFGFNHLASAAASFYRSKGGELTAILDSMGQNDTNEVNTAEEIRVYRLAVPWKWEYCKNLAGRDVVFSIQELGSKRTDTSTFSDDAMQECRRSQNLLVDAYAGGVRGAQTWDQATSDTIHMLSYDEIGRRHARSVAAKLGYTTTTQFRGPVIESATKNTGTGEVTAQVRLNSLSSATTLEPATGVRGFRISNNGVLQPINFAGVTVGVPVSGLVPVVIPCSAGYDLTGTVTLDFKRGGGLDQTIETTASAINAIRPDILRDNGPQGLGVEWKDALAVT